MANEGSTAATMEYTLKPWTALTHHLNDDAVLIDNNHLERQLKFWALGRKDLDVRGQRTGWATRCGSDELVAVGTHVWLRAVGLPERCFAAAVDAAQQPHRRPTTASSAARLKQTRTICKVDLAGRSS